jgi:hypothetical protein
MVSVPQVVSPLVEPLTRIARFVRTKAAVFVQLVVTLQGGRLLQLARAANAFPLKHAASVVQADSRREGRSNLIAPVCTLACLAGERWAIAKVEGILLVVRRPPLVQFVPAAGHADTAQRVDTPLEQAPGIQTAQI